jgi:uncharacterized membrane protein YphA (DoxX/SURF4 family)
MSGSEWMRFRRVDLLMRLTLGGVFIWAGWVKVADPQGFATAVRNYQLLPEALVNPVALLLPWIEVLCGGLMICGVWVSGSVFIVNVLLAVFIAALALNWVRGVDVSCGCFSTVDAKQGADYLADILRDAALLAVGIFIFRRRARYAATKAPGG